MSTPFDVLQDQIKKNTTGGNVDSEITLGTYVYQRKIFLVEAVQVAEDNMSLTAQWCGGEVVQTPYTDKKHISVPVKRPLNRRQTTAFVGDWVLKANKGFKVYTDKAFKENFEMPETDAK